MAKAKKAKQLFFMIPDKAGLLDMVTAVLAAAKVNISAICAYGMDRKANFMMTTDSNARAKKVLAKHKIRAREYNVFVVDMTNKPGELQKVANSIGKARINIKYMYGTTGAGRTATFVFSTSNDAKAIRLINK